MRLARFLAAAGIASRRRAEDLIRAGKVTVNGAVVDTPAFTVDPAADAVFFAGAPVTVSAKQTILLNKPRGYTCSAKDEHAEHLVTELLPKEFGRLFTVGRLDRDSEGLLLCTNDGELAQRLAHPRHGVRKTYHVWVRGAVQPHVLKTFLDGITGNGEFLHAVAARVCDLYPAGTVIELVLAEGRKREIRRLCLAVGLTIERLVRVAYGPLRLGTLHSGQWRHLTPEEVRLLESPE